MQPGDIATFVERPGIKYNALVVKVEGDGANIVWLAPDSTKSWRVKQATFPFFKDGMTAQYISTPVAVEPDPVMETAGPIQPPDLTDDATNDGDSSPDPDADNEESDIDGLGPLVKGQAEELE